MAMLFAIREAIQQTENSLKGTSWRSAQPKNGIQIFAGLHSEDCCLSTQHLATTPEETTKAKLKRLGNVTKTRKRTSIRKMDAPTGFEGNVIGVTKGEIWEQGK